MSRHALTMDCRLARIMRTFILLVVCLCFLPEVGRAALCPVGRPIDYLAPLRHLPQIREIPPNHRLPFAPHNLTVLPFKELLAGGGKGGFEIFSTSRRKVNSLDWTVTLTARRVNAKGELGGSLGTRRVRLRGSHSYSREPLYLEMNIPRKPGFYRTDLTIQRPHHPPATFSQYIRVVTPKRNAVLHLARSSYLPGETVTMRLENHGTVYLDLSEDRFLEQWDGAQWVRVEEEESWSFGIGRVLPPGAVWKCERLLLPATLPPGSYRVEKSISALRFARGYFAVR